MLYKQKHFSDKKWKQIFDKEFQLHRATVKKKSTRSCKAAIFILQQKKQGCGKHFFALFYIQKDLSMAKSFCGLRHCREQAHPAQWKVEEPCQEATAISGCHWWVGWPSGHRDASSLSPCGHTGKSAFFWAPEGQRTGEFPWDTAQDEPLGLWFCAGSTCSSLSAKQLTHVILSNQKLHVLTHLTHSLAFKQSTVAITNWLVHLSNFIWLKTPKNKVYSHFSQATISNSSVNFIYRTNNYNNSQFRLSILSNKQL